VGRACWLRFAFVLLPSERPRNAVVSAPAQRPDPRIHCSQCGECSFRDEGEGTKRILFPYADIAAFRSHPRVSGIPFLGPWANRLDEQAFYASGKRYAFNMDLGNISGAHPIHGFLSFTDKWTVTEVKADREAAWVTSRLDFYREPSWMAQFPFAHTIDMTYRLAAGVLEVRLRLQNLSSEPMPVSVGFHPYFQLTDSSREDWTVRIGAKKHWLLNGDKIPTGEIWQASFWIRPSGF
jgi:aldose 1-epimerase